MKKTLTHQYHTICAHKEDLEKLCIHKCDGEHAAHGATIWVFKDNSTLKIDRNGVVTVDGRLI